MSVAARVSGPKHMIPHLVRFVYVESEANPLRSFHSTSSCQTEPPVVTAALRQAAEKAAKHDATATVCRLKNA